MFKKIFFLLTLIQFSFSQERELCEYCCNNSRDKAIITQKQYRSRPLEKKLDAILERVNSI